MNDAPERLYCSAGNGDPWKHRLATLPHRFAGGAAVSVLVGEADAGFRWGLDLEHSADGGRTWTGHSTCFSFQSGAAAASFDSWPETGSLRLVAKVTDANAAGRVWGALSITVR